jgi:hypothetical protein
MKRSTRCAFRPARRRTGAVGGKPAAPRTLTAYPAAVRPGPGAAAGPSGAPGGRPGGPMRHPAGREGRGVGTVRRPGAGQDRSPVRSRFVAPRRSMRYRCCRDGPWSERRLVRGSRVRFARRSARASAPRRRPGRSNRMKRSTGCAFRPVRARPDLPDDRTGRNGRPSARFARLAPDAAGPGARRRSSPTKRSARCAIHPARSRRCGRQPTGRAQTPAPYPAAAGPRPGSGDRPGRSARTGSPQN